ncbi:MAG: GTPase Era [Thermoanaerobaculia bacterium]
MPEETFRSGTVAVVGLPNAGKSTLVNRLVGTKVAIVSDKPQTTRKRILGVATRPGAQVVLVDTPGIHRPEHRMNAAMVRDAFDAMTGSDVVLFVVDASEKHGREERRIAERLAREGGPPAVLALNKIDRVQKAKLLPQLALLSSLAPFAHLVPISALHGDGVEELMTAVISQLPEGPALFPEENPGPGALRDKIAEQIREPALSLTREEVPFSLAVVVEDLRRDETRDLTVVDATLWVEREGQKAIVIGKGGSMIREIGTAARAACESRFGGKFYLDLRVRTRDNWREDDGFLTQIVNPEV